MKRKDFLLMKTKHIIASFLLTSILSMHTTCAAAAPTALVPARTAETHEDATQFPNLEMIFGDAVRGFKGSFCATPRPEVMAQKDAQKNLNQTNCKLALGYLGAIEQLEELVDADPAHFGQLKANLRRALTMQAAPQKPRRGLVNIGGGSKGLVEIVALSYLEEIINNEENKSRFNQQRAVQRLEPLDYIYISDLFDCAAGTSTGSIIAAGLFYNKNVRYKAHEVAQLYVRCLENIFGADKKNSKANIGAAKYDPSGLEALLQTFFPEGSTIGNSFARKPVHIYAVNKDQPDIIRFNPSSFEDVPLWQAVRASSSAPYYFPHMEFTSKGKTYKATDGGTIINNPAADLVAEQHLTEVYAFGAGTVEHLEEERANWLVGAVVNGVVKTELVSALKTVMGTMPRTQTMSIHSVLRSANDLRGSVEFFAHLNPTIPHGTHMDFSDQPTMHKMINAAMRETETDVFNRMVEQLGFTMHYTENAEQRSKLCLYGDIPRLTTELRYNTLQAIYTLHAYQIDEGENLRTDSYTNRDSGAVIIYTPSAASIQLEARNALLLEYIRKGMNPIIGAKFLATVELPSDFETPRDWPDNVQEAIGCLQTCKEQLNNLLNDINISDVLSNNAVEIEKLAANFSRLCTSCKVHNDSHLHLPLVAAVCAQYVMSTVDIQAGSPTALSAQAGYRQSEAMLQEQSGLVTRAFQLITFSTPQSRNIKFFEEINNIIEFLNTPAGTASPAGSREDLPKLAGSPTATTPLSPGTAGQGELVRHTAAAEPSEAVPNGFQTMLQNATPEERTAMLGMLQQSAT